MKVIVLAAGYATRLYPKTLTQPKAKLHVAGKPMIEYVIDSLTPIEGIDVFYIVTNDKFVSHFHKWLSGYRNSHPKHNFIVVNDGSSDDSNKLGAIGDLHFVLTHERVDDDIIVVAGDNLFSHSLGPFGEYCRKKNAPLLAVYDIEDLEAVKKFSSINVDHEGRIVRFEEKPKHPTSTLIGIALYYYPKQILPLIKQYIAEGNNPDQPGRLVQWLYPKVPFYTWSVAGIWYDVGSNETLEEANRVFAQVSPGK